MNDQLKKKISQRIFNHEYSDETPVKQNDYCITGQLSMPIDSFGDRIQSTEVAQRRGSIEGSLDLKVSEVSSKLVF